MRDIKTGYTVEVDIAGRGDNAEAVRQLRQELRPLRIHAVVIELDDPNGNVCVRLSSLNRTALRRWLDGQGYEADAHPIVNRRNPNAVARTK